MDRTKPSGTAGLGGAKRPYGSGSIYYVTSVGRWRYAESSQIDGRRVRRMVERRTRDELLAYLRESKRRSTVSGIDHSQDKAIRADRRATATGFVETLIRTGRIDGWAADYLARVIVASLAPRRIRLRVFGPCVYCGDWLADTVDHATPTARGGTDDPTNLVSACHRCNSEKRARLDYVR